MSNALNYLISKWLDRCTEKLCQTDEAKKEFPSTTYDALMDVDDSDEDEARKWAKFAAHVEERCQKAELAPGSSGCSHMRRWVLDDYRRLFQGIVSLGKEATLSALAAHMDRSFGSIQSRLFMLGLVEVVPPATGLSGGVWHGQHKGYAPYSSGFLFWSQYGRPHKMHIKVCGIPVELEHLAIETGLFKRDGKHCLAIHASACNYLVKGEVKKGS